MDPANTNYIKRTVNFTPTISLKVNGARMMHKRVPRSLWYDQFSIAQFCPTGTFWAVWARQVPVSWQVKPNKWFTKLPVAMPGAVGGVHRLHFNRCW